MLSSQQVVYWDVLEKKYASEVNQQQEVFSSEQGSQRQKDFRCQYILIGLCHSHFVA